MLSVTALVDQAIAKNARGELPGEDSYTQFSSDLLSALPQDSVPSYGTLELRLFSSKIANQYGRLIAWALMRYLGNHRTFPSQPSDLRPRAITFIRDNISQDLRHHHIDFNLQSHEIESALNKVVPTIEQSIREATQFRSLDTISHFRRNLFATINDRHHAGLIYTFSNRSKVNEELTRSLDAVIAFTQADAFSVIDMYQRAQNACIDAQADLNSDGTYYTTDLLSSVPKALQQAIERQIVELDIAQSTTLSLAPVAKKYPLHLPNTDIELRLILANCGPGTASDVHVQFESTSELQLTRDGLHVGNLSPNESRSIQIGARVLTPEAIALLSAEVHWLNFDRRQGSLVVDLELAGQDATIDWSALSRRQPYNLEVAIDRRFIGRDTLLNQILSRVTAPNPGSLYLWGQKRVGKTSLVQTLASKIRARFPDFAVVYLETIRELTPEETTNAICRRLISALKITDPRFATAAEPVHTGTLSPLSDFLDQLLQIVPDKKFLIIIDEFDELPVELYRGRGVADTFFQMLGKGIAAKTGVGVILVGGERIPRIIRAQGMRLNMYRPQQIDHFERDDDFSQLVRVPGAPLEFSDDAVDQLWHYSDGNPYFLNEICSRLAERMIQRRDAYITAAEVSEAIDRTLDSIESNSFAHYWADGILEVDTSQARASLTDRIRLLAAAAEVIDRGSDTVSKETLTKQAKRHGCTATDVEQTLRDFQSRGIIVDNGKGGGYSFRVKLFQEWLRGRGRVELAAQLYDDLGNRERMAEERDALIAADELDGLVARWGTYQGGTVSPHAVRQWLSQFGSPQDQRLMFRILQGLQYYTLEKMRECLTHAHRAVVADLVTDLSSNREHRRDLVVSYLGTVSRSGPSMARLYRQQNRIWHQNCIEPGSISEFLDNDARASAIVFVDDFIGTGRTATRQFGEFFEQHPSVGELVEDRQLNVWYVTVAGTVEGIRKLRGYFDTVSPRVKVIAGDELGAESRAFSPESPLWADSSERQLAKEIAKSFGERLEGRAPLGFGDIQGLTVFEANCPNTSLPILHKRRKVLGDTFQPLFPRST